MPAINNVAVGHPSVSISRTTFTRRPQNYDLPKTGVTKKHILETVKQQKVQFLNMQFIDLQGVIKAVTIPVHKLGEAIEEGVWIDGSSIDGFMRICESDMYLKLDLDTFALIPWTLDSEAVTARIICDVHMPDGKPFEGDPRRILKRQLEEAKKLGYTFNTGPELEFFLFSRDRRGRIKPLPHDNASYFDQTNDLAADIRKDMAYALQVMGIEVEALHHEVDGGHHEIVFRYQDALATADNATTLKMVLKAIAAKYGLHATFMAKPITGIAGSGMHTHQSLFKGNENAFYEQTNNGYHLSELARSFIAGQIEHIKAMTAVTNPTVNSYKRLVLGYEAPVYIAWAQINRSALIRVPRFSKGKKKATRLELRSPDPACNAYLAFAVMLAAGLDGVKRKLTPPEPVEEDIYHLSDKEVAQMNIDRLPASLKRALEELEKDDLIQKVLGEHTYRKFRKAKLAEWDDYQIQVSQWEIDRYLEVH